MRRDRIHLASREARASDKRSGYVTACRAYSLIEVPFLWDIPREERFFNCKML
jgi:hypothetical protein